VLLVFCATETAYTYDKIAQTQSGTSPDFVARRGWLDRALPQGSRAAIVLTTLGERAASVADWWDAAFWNKTVTGIYYLPGSDNYSTGFAQQIDVDPATGRVAQLDEYGYFVRSGLDTRLSLRGSTTAATSGGFLVVQAERPYRAEWTMTGGDSEGGYLPPGTNPVIRAWRDPAPARAHKVGVTLAAPDDAKAPIPVTISAGDMVARASLRPGDQRTLELDAPYAASGATELQVAVPAGAAGALRLIAVAQP
jgi:hypothetical protein